MDSGTRQKVFDRCLRFQWHTDSGGKIVAATTRKDPQNHIWNGCYAVYHLVERSIATANYYEPDTIGDGFVC
jgi:hypothetical protein